MSHSTILMPNTDKSIANVKNRLAIGAELPAYLREHGSMKILWDETSIGISLSNDILSLKKELRSDGVLSAIPLAVNAGLALQPAVDEALVILRHSISRLSAAAERIVLEVPEGSEEHLSGRSLSTT